MRPFRPTFLKLPSGKRIRLGFAGCVHCRRLVGVVLHESRARLWEYLGFSQDGQTRFLEHVCTSERRRDVARDAKLERERNGNGTHR